MRYANFIGGSFPTQSPVWSGERTINWYVEAAETGGAKAPSALLPVPGVTTFATHATQSPVRALWAQNDRCFAIIGTACVEVSSDGTLTHRGTVAVDVGTDPATITSNGDGGGQLLITSGGRLYTMRLNGNFWKCANDWHTWESPFVMGAMLDGYFLALDQTSTVWVSSLLDGETWDALGFVQRSLGPDRWVAMAVVGRDLWLLGEATSEVWYNAGTTTFPFAPHPSGLISTGCAAKWSLATAGDTLCWLASTREGTCQVVRASGLSVTPISPKALDYTLGTYSVISDAVGWTYQQAGHTFYVLTFPTANATWAYDLTTGVWCERGTWVSGTASYEAWRPQYHAFAFGTHLVGDRNAGTIYELSLTADTDAGGAEIRRVRRAPVLSNEAKRLFFHRFTLDLEAGLGVAGGDGADPQILLRYSNDGGKTWAEAGAASIDSGAQGQYQTRAIWRRLGSSRNRVFELVASDPAPYKICDAYLALTPSDETP